jgi:hypothetical protein
MLLKSIQLHYWRPLPPLKFTDKEVNKDYEVLTKPKEDWEYSWE